MMEDCGTDQTRTALLLGGTGEVGKQVIIIIIVIIIIVIIIIVISIIIIVITVIIIVPTLALPPIANCANLP